MLFLPFGFLGLSRDVNMSAKEPIDGNSVSSSENSSCSDRTASFTSSETEEGMENVFEGADFFSRCALPVGIPKTFSSTQPENSLILGIFPIYTEAAPAFNSALSFRPSMPPVRKTRIRKLGFASSKAFTASTGATLFGFKKASGVNNTTSAWDKLPLRESKRPWRPRGGHNAFTCKLSFVSIPAYFLDTSPTPVTTRINFFVMIILLEIVNVQN